MNTPVLNREFKHPEDGWYQIEALGEHPNARANVVQVIDAQAAADIANRFSQEASKAGFAGMLVDHEHFKHDAGKESRAYGWLMELTNRADGIYGKIKWTATGKQAVDSGDYRFFSTEYNPAEMQVLNRGQKPARVRPVQLAGLTLTNMPNNKGGKPITNRQDESKNMKTIAEKLGLAADSTEEAVLAEVTKILNRATEAEGKVVPLQTRVTELETANSALIGEQIEADLAGAGVTEEKVLNRLRPVLAGLKNREERIAFLGDVIAKPEVKSSAAPGMVLNRDGAKVPTDGKGAKDATLIRNRAAELVKSGMSTEQAWAQATKEAKA